MYMTFDGAIGKFACILSQVSNRVARNRYLLAHNCFSSYLYNKHILSVGILAASPCFLVVFAPKIKEILHDSHDVIYFY